MSTEFVVGKANYNGQAVEKTPYYRLGHKTEAERTLIVRIAPPLGALAQDGIWARFVKQHFGYVLPFVTSKGEKKYFPATFLCPENTDRNGNITTPCPECEEIRRQNKKVEAKEAELKNLGKSDEEIAVAVQPLKAWLKEHNVDKKWNLVAKDTSGKWGFLTISYKAMKLLREQIKDLVDKGLDPLSGEKGVWWRFKRTGTAWNEITDTPAPETEELPDGTIRRKYDSLTSADIEQLSKLPSLSSLGRALTYDQIQSIVTSMGDEQVIRTVMNLPVITPRGTQQQAATQAVTPPAAAKPQAPASQPAPVAVDPEEAAMAELKAKLAAMEAKKAAAKSAPIAPSPSPVPSPELVSDMEVPMEEFLSRFGKS